MAREFTRTQRVNKLLREEISRLLQHEVKDARVGMVTISDVEVSPDLKYATVYVQAPGGEDRKAEALAGLRSAAGFLRSRLGRELRLRRIPELRFEIDRAPEHAARIAQLLAEVRDEAPAGEGEDES
jgi:ribosome-binding factor A